MLLFIAVIVNLIQITTILNFVDSVGITFASCAEYVINVNFVVKTSVDNAVGHIIAGIIMPLTRSKPMATEELLARGARRIL